MIRIGDRVKLNIEAIEKNGMSDGDEQRENFDYILDHADEVYIIKSTTSKALAPFELDHPLLGHTSFFEDELILIERGEFRYELSK